MSIIREHVILLSDIIADSNLIVEVDAIEAYEESVPVLSDEEKAVPDFIKKGMVFRIKRVLKNTDDTNLPELIRVPNENWRRSLSQHKEEYANGPSKSFTVNIYKTLVPKMSEAEILFLRRFQDSFELTAKNSFEFLANIKAIEDR